MTQHATDINCSMRSLTDSEIIHPGDLQWTDRDGKYRLANFTQGMKAIDAIKRGASHGERWVFFRVMRASEVAEPTAEKADLASNKPAPKPSKAQPLTGYRLLGSAADDPRVEGDQYWSLALKGWAVLTSHKVEYANQYDWPACRKIEMPIDEPTASPQGMLPPSGYRWIDCGETLIGTDEYINRRGGRGLVEKPFVGLGVVVQNLFVRKIEPPPKRYREPTQADLANVPIACEYRGDDDEQWRSGLLVYILSGVMPYLCTDKEEQLCGQWEQCRIEVTE